MSPALRRIFCVMTVAGAATVAGFEPVAAAEPVTVTDRVAAVEVPANWIRSVTAACEKGEEAVGGGYGVQASRYTEPLTGAVPLNQFPVLASYPSSPTSWTVTVYNRSREPVLVTAHVECLSVGAGTRIVSAPVGIGYPATRVECPRDTTMVTGGGWRITGTTEYEGLVDILDSYAIGTSWKVVARPPAGSIAKIPPMQVTGYAVCAGKPLVPGSYQPVMAVAPAGPKDMATDATVEVGCADGELLTGAGHHMHDNEVGMTTFFPRHGTVRRWVFTIYSLPTEGFHGVENRGASAWAGPLCAKLA
jgi:hypothetical protein